MNEKATNFHNQQGVLHMIFNAKNVTKDPTKKDFWVREFMLEIAQTKGEQTFKSAFPLFSLSGENRINMLDAYSEGDEVVVTFVLKGNKYKRKDTGEDTSFTSLECISLEKVVGVTQAAPVDNKHDVTQKEGSNNFGAFDESDSGDLPF